MPMRNLLLVFLGFTTVAAIASLAVGDPDAGLLTDKLEHWQENLDAYDTLFFGSSRIYRGIDPTTFDAAMAAQGSPTKSFNFGIAGMEAHETNALIRRVLQSNPTNLRRVIVEIDTWDPVIDPRNRLKRRGILWHDAHETRSALRSTRLLDTDWRQRADLAITHIVHFAARATAAGRGRDLLMPPSTKKPDFAQRGFKTFSERSYQHHPMRRSFLADLEGFERSVAALPARNAESAPTARYNVDALRDQIAMIRDAGAEPIHVVPPSPRATPAILRLARTGQIPHLLPFNQPTVDPELFALDHRFDREHLTHDGAILFTQRLAERLVAAADRN